MSDTGHGTRAPLAAARRLWRRVDAWHDAFFVGRWRSGMAREVRRREDVLLALVFLESLGIEDPARAHALELYPELVGSFHRWHREQGIDRFPDPGVCC